MPCFARRAGRSAFGRRRGFRRQRRPLAGGSQMPPAWPGLANNASPTPYRSSVTISSGWAPETITFATLSAMTSGGVEADIKGSAWRIATFTREIAPDDELALRVIYGRILLPDNEGRCNLGLAKAFAARGLCPSEASVTAFDGDPETRAPSRPGSKDRVVDCLPSKPLHASTELRRWRHSRPLESPASPSAAAKAS